MAKLSLEEIQRDTIWVAKMTYGRHVGTYEELKEERNSEECRDFDISCKQPEHLKEFFDAYMEYERKNGWITIPEFYNSVYAVQKEEDSKMVTVEVKITEKQLEFLKKKAGKRSITSELTEMVMNGIDGMIWMEEHQEEVKTNGATISN